MNCLLETESGTEEKNYDVFSLEYGTVCRRDMDTDISRQRSDM